MLSPSTRTVRGLSRSGFSIMELIVAMAMVSILLSSVYFTWNHVNRHMATQKRKGLFKEEALRVTQDLRNQIRKSPRVISLDTRQLTLLSKTGSDTVSYYFNGENLLRNDSAIFLRSPDMKVIEFEIHDPQMRELEAPLDRLLEISFRFQNRFGDTLSSRISVRAHIDQSVTIDNFDF